MSVAPKAYRYQLLYPIQSSNSLMLADLPHRVQRVSVAVQIELRLNLLPLLDDIDWKPECA